MKRSRSEGRTERKGATRGGGGGAFFISARGNGWGRVPVVGAASRVGWGARRGAALVVGAPVVGVGLVVGVLRAALALARRALTSRRHLDTSPDT